MNEKVDIEIFRRKLTVEMDGFTPIEVNALAARVSEKMSEISAHNERIADSSKLAILTALNFAAELSKLREAQDTDRLIVERKIDELTLALQTALSTVEARGR